MSMKIKIKGLDDLQKQLKQMERGAKELQGKHSIPLSDLFTHSFMRNYTKFTSFDKFLTAGGFHVEKQSDFDDIPEAELNRHVSKTTKFRSWDEMLEKATDIYISKKLGL